MTSIAGEEELRIFSKLPAGLHHGEASCIAIASHRDWQFLSDDLAARNQARTMGVAISGSIGCLVLTVEREICSLAEANNWLQAMIDQDYRSPVSDLTPLLRG